MIQCENKDWSTRFRSWLIVNFHDVIFCHWQNIGTEMHLLQNGHIHVVSTFILPRCRFGLSSWETVRRNSSIRCHNHQLAPLVKHNMRDLSRNQWSNKFLRNDADYLINRLCYTIITFDRCRQNWPFECLKWIAFCCFADVPIVIEKKWELFSNCATKANWFIWTFNHLCYVEFSPKL
jgi:hypothetical protein